MSLRTHFQSLAWFLHDENRINSTPTHIIYCYNDYNSEVKLIQIILNLSIQNRIENVTNNVDAELRESCQTQLSCCMLSDRIGNFVVASKWLKGKM